MDKVSSNPSKTLDDLRAIADYREDDKGGYISKSIFGLGSSRALTLDKEGNIAVAPYSFFGSLLAWVKPSNNSSDTQIKQNIELLKAKIQTTLEVALEIGSSQKAAPGIRSSQEAVTALINRTITQDKTAITRNDLRQIIRNTELQFNQNSQKIFLLKNQVNNKQSDTSEKTATSGTPNIKAPNIVQETTESITSLRKAIESHLGKQEFDPKKVQELLQETRTLKNYIKDTQYSITLSIAEEEVSRSPDSTNKTSLDALSASLAEPKALLEIKEKNLTEYLHNDPFNHHNVLYPRRVFAEAAKVTFEKAYKDTETDQATTIIEKEPTSQDSSQDPAVIETGKFQAWYNDEVKAYDEAKTKTGTAINSTDPNATEAATRAHDPSFYLDKNNGENPFVEYSATRVVSELQRLARDAGLPVSQHFSSLSAAEVNKAAQSAMNTTLPWETTTRDFVFQLGEKTQAYRLRSTPLSESNTQVGQELKKKSIKGIVPATRDDGRAPINARMTQLFRLEWNEEKQFDEVLIQERQQHGINDHFAIKDPQERHKANISSMKQLVQSAAEADPDFIRQARENTEENKISTLVYINTNLTTPTWMPRGPLNDEWRFSRHQGNAMKNTNGSQTFQGLNAGASSEQAKQDNLIDVNINVQCIDLRFPVNYATSSIWEDPKALDPGMIPAWPELHRHNTTEFTKLFGSLEKGQAIEGFLKTTCDKLEATNLEHKKLQETITSEVEEIRRLFNTKEYKKAGNDRFKMPRHIDILANAFRQASKLVDGHSTRVVNAGGCMSGKDREGVAGVEGQAAAIIQDLKNNSSSSTTSTKTQENELYEMLLTSVVDNTRQVTGIGGSKNAQEIANQITNKDAGVYAQGASTFTET